MIKTYIAALKPAVSGKKPENDSKHFKIEFFKTVNITSLPNS